MYFPMTVSLSTFIAVIFCAQETMSTTHSKCALPCDPNVEISEKELFHFLFANYSKEVRPTMNYSRPIDVQVQLQLDAVNDLVERENTLVLNGFILLVLLLFVVTRLLLPITKVWQDEYLKWDSLFPYCCIADLAVPASNVWLPDVLLINSPNGAYSLMDAPGFTVWIGSNGFVSYEPGGRLETMCKIDVTFFPFDRQTCELTFESWDYDSRKQIFHLPSKNAFARSYDWTESQQWLVESNSSKVYIKDSFFDDAGYRYYRAAFTLVLRRKAMYYCVNIIVPSAIISMVEMATFVLPIEEVMKVHISFTSLLAYSFFQGIVMSDLPRSGDRVPLLILYIDLQMAYIGVIALMGDALVFLIIRKGESRKSCPGESLLDVFKIIAMLLFLERPKVLKRTKKRLSKLAVSVSSASELVIRPELASETSLDFDSAISKIAESTSPTTCHTFEMGYTTVGTTAVRPTPDEIWQQWRFIAEVVDRLNMVLYVTAITITPLAMFASVPS